MIKKLLAFLCMVSIAFTCVACSDKSGEKSTVEDTLLPSLSSSEVEIAIQPQESSEEDVTLDDYMPGPGEDAYYQELADRKAELVDLVRERVEAYRQGTAADVSGHHPTYPVNFPPVSELPDINDTDDFAVRFAGNPDALGSVYLAVPIGDSGEYELHMTASEGEVDGQIGWMSGNTFFEKISDLKWHKQDIDLYSDD